MQLTRDDADKLNVSGNALRNSGQLQSALALYERALAVQPDHAGALYNRGSVLLQLGRPAEAVRAFELLLARSPDDAEAHFHRGDALMALRRHAEALASFDRALAIEPNAAVVLNRRGNALRVLGRPIEALDCYERAAMLGPADPDALVHRGIALQDLRRRADALECYDQALALRPNDVVALNNRGNALRDLVRATEALASYDRALALDPGNAGVKYNRSLCRLLVGDFARGWREYECRWQGDAMDTPKRDFAQPLWLGETPIAGKTILLHAEQGLGDTLQFCRYAPLVAGLGATVVLQVQAPLKRLLGSLGGVSAVLDGADALPRFDLHCPLMSLPLAFGTRVETIPAEVPYLRSDPAAVARWSQELGPRTSPRVGLAWSGSTVNKHDPDRSIPLAEFDRFSPERAQLVSLQCDLRPADAAVLARRTDIRDIGRSLADFADTAAVVSSMDLVITACTSVAHLAGALGKPVWVVLPFNADWRWFLRRSDSPWYPTARLFRQESPGEWGTAIARVATELENLRA